MYGVAKVDIETGAPDPELPLWCAEYSHEKLRVLLGASFTRSELYIYLIFQAAKEQTLRVPGANWAQFLSSTTASYHETPIICWQGFFEALALYMFVLSVIRVGFDHVQTDEGSSE